MNENKEIVIQSWNPFTGCTKISPACVNCYAETLALKLNKWGTAGYENKFKFTVHNDRLEKATPLKRRKPTLHFINNMSDTFHEEADEKSIDEIMNIVRKAHWHNFYILTKRSERMREYFNKNDVPDNLWIGVTVEDRKYGIPRLKDLQQINCKKKHICCEPLLEDLGHIDLSQISFVIGGGESAIKARRTQLSWVESLQNQCMVQNVHFYWKQWGSYGEDGVYKGNGKTDYLINGKVVQSIPDNFMP
ncbi:DUF5131 family protein [Cetobacterium sp.]|uniref:DUF5131 family protein n=1 Tax=Cetobacterium sp. TaxID=2071632 RepID=UPI003F3C1C71